MSLFTTSFLSSFLFQPPNFFASFSLPHKSCDSSLFDHLPPPPFASLLNPLLLNFLYYPLVSSILCRYPPPFIFPPLLELPWIQGGFVMLSPYTHSRFNISLPLQPPLPIMNPSVGCMNCEEAEHLPLRLLMTFARCPWLPAQPRCFAYRRACAGTDTLWRYQLNKENAKHSCKCSVSSSRRFVFGGWNCSCCV